MRRGKRKLLFWIALVFCGGCAYVEPFVQEFNIISIPQEREIGRQIAQEISKEMPLVEGTRADAFVQSVGRRLVSVLPRRDFAYRFYVVKDAAPNAFTIPGGSIYVHTGLLDFVSDESELAGVLAHEIGHAYDRHPAKALSRQMGVQSLTQLLFQETQAQGQFRQMALQLAQGGFLTRYGREDERIADEMAYSILRRAGGYRTDGLLRFLKKLQSLDQGATPLAFLSSHPPTPERIARLEALERGGAYPPAGEAGRPPVTSRRPARFAP